MIVPWWAAILAVIVGAVIIFAAGMAGALIYYLIEKAKRFSLRELLILATVIAVVLGLAVYAAGK